MPVLIRQNWDQLKEIWSHLEKSASAPIDMYIELLRTALRKTEQRALFDEHPEVFSEPELARKEFLALLAPDSEAQCIVLLEGFYETLLDFNTQVAERYRTYLKRFVDERNLRYRIVDGCKFHITIEGMLTSEVDLLRNLVSGNALRQRSFAELERNIARLREGSGDEENCIRVASNLLEGIAIDTTSNGGTTLGVAVDGCAAFPHTALRQCVRDFYAFASDFPNVRHGGRASSWTRDIKKDDALLAAVFAIGFGLYVLNNDASVTILSGDT